MLIYEILEFKLTFERMYIENGDTVIIEVPNTKIHRDVVRARCENQSVNDNGVELWGTGEVITFELLERFDVKN